MREIFVLFRAWHGTIDSGLFTKRRNLRYSKTRIAYYSNSTATQALLLSQEKAASTNNNYPGRNQQQPSAISVRKQLGGTKRTFHVPIVWDVFT